MLGSREDLEFGGQIAVRSRKGDVVRRRIKRPSPAVRREVGARLRFAVLTLWAAAAAPLALHGAIKTATGLQICSAKWLLMAFHPALIGRGQTRQPQAGAHEVMNAPHVKLVVSQGSVG